MKTNALKRYLLFCFSISLFAFFVTPDFLLAQKSQEEQKQPLEEKKVDVKNDDETGAVEKKENSIPVTTKKKKGVTLFIIASCVIVAAGFAYYFLVYKKNLKGKIQVNSNPTGAKIFLDRIDTGKNTNASLEKVAKGKHTVSLTLAGYDTYSATVTVKSGETTTISADLTKSHVFEWVSTWGSKGSGDGQFNGAAGIAVDSNGMVYVSDYLNNVIQKFSSTGGFLAKWGSMGYTGEGKFYINAGIAADNSGFIYVSDFGNHCIQKFTSSGTFIAKWGSYGSGDLEFNNPGAICCDNVGYLYVYDISNYRIVKMTDNGSFVKKWGSQGSGNGQLNGIAENIPIMGIAYYSGHIYVSDHYNYRVQKFTSNGDFVTKWGTEGTGEGQFKSIEGIAVDSSGYVYVCDSYYNHRIQKFTNDGKWLAMWGSEGRGSGLFLFPFGIAIDSAGYAYVSDWECIHKYRTK